MAESSLWNMEGRIEQAVLKSGQATNLVQYSAYKLDDNDEPIDNLDEIAAHGKVVLVKAADPRWGGKHAEDYRSPVLENPTWLQVCIYANRMIRSVKDQHHCFLENIKEVGKEGDITLYEFVMGS